MAEGGSEAKTWHICLRDFKLHVFFTMYSSPPKNPDFNYFLSLLGLMLDAIYTANLNALQFDPVEKQWRESVCCFIIYGFVFASVSDIKYLKYNFVECTPGFMLNQCCRLGRRRRHSLHAFHLIIKFVAILAYRNQP